MPYNRYCLSLSKTYDFILGMIDDTDTYVFRDVLTDDMIFVTPEDLINNGLNNDTSYDTDVSLINRYSLYFIFLIRLILN